MTTVPMNPPTDKVGDQNQLFVPPNTQDSSSLSYCCSSFFNIQYDRTEKIGGLQSDQDQDQKPVLLHGGSSSGQVSQTSAQPVKDDQGNNVDGRKMEGEQVIRSSCRSTKWMSSKMRLMQKMMTPDDPEASNIMDHNQRQGNSQRSPSSNGYTTTRVCADCKTTTTPLWRSGPKGPKSLCNACGIRQRKARRAMAEAAANGLVIDSTSTKSRIYNKEKKHGTNHLAQFKNKCKATTAGTPQEKRKLGFKDFALSLSNKSTFEQVFPPDEVAEAALLLMDLSCGRFVYI